MSSPCWHSRREHQAQACSLQTLPAAVHQTLNGGSPVTQEVWVDAVTHEVARPEARETLEGLVIDGIPQGQCRDAVVGCQRVQFSLGVVVEGDAFGGPWGYMGTVGRPEVDLHNCWGLRLAEQLPEHLLIPSPGG